MTAAAAVASPGARRTHGTGAARAAVTRVLTSGSAGALTRFEDGALLAGGHVNLISFEILAEQMAGRWPQRRHLVDRYVELLLERQIAGAGSFLKVSDTDYLVCQPELERLPAQLACLGFMRKTFQHFVGSSTRAPEGLHAVAAIAAGRIEAALADIEALREAETRRDAEQARAKALAQATAPFVVSDGRSVRVSCVLEPVLELKGNTPIGYRLARRVSLAETGEDLQPAELAGLAGVDILRMDLASALHGCFQVRTAAGPPPPTLILPVSYASLAGQRGRSEIVSAIKDARDITQRGIICELSGIEGAPHAALHEVVSTVRPFALFVVGRFAEGRLGAARQARGVGLRGLAVECPPVQDGAEFIGWARATISVARQITNSVLLYGADSTERTGLLAKLGATHASLKTP